MKILKAIIIVLIALSLLGLAKDWLVKTAVTVTASKVLGTPVHIEHLSLSLLRQSIRITGLKVGQPTGFASGTMIDVPQVGIDYDLRALIKGNLHFPNVIFNLKELNVVRNQYNQLNIDALRIAQKNPALGNPQEKNPEKNMPLQIDTLVLNLGQVTVRDYTVNPDDVRTFNIGIDHKIYHNIQSGQQLAGLVLIEAIHPVSTLKDAAIFTAASFLKVPVSAADVFFSSSSQLLKNLNPFK